MLIDAPPFLVDRVVNFHRVHATNDEHLVGLHLARAAFRLLAATK